VYVAGHVKALWAAGAGGLARRGAARRFVTRAGGVESWDWSESVVRMVWAVVGVCGRGVACRWGLCGGGLVVWVEVE